MSAQGPIRAAESTRADWRTPPALFGWLDGIFKFKLDVAASSANTLCEFFIDEELNALSIDAWGDVDESLWGIYSPRRAFCNPPYGDLMPWVQEFSRQQENGRWLVVALLPANTDTRWFTHCWETASEIWFLTPRVSFIDPVTELPVKGNTTGSMICIWHPNRLAGGYPPVVRHLNWKTEVNRS